MELDQWLTTQDGIAHRSRIAAMGFDRSALRRSSARGIGQRWLALESAPADLVAAAQVHGRVACMSAAARLGMALLRPPAEFHLWVPRNARASRQSGIRLHRARVLDPVAPTALVCGVVDVLSHLAACLSELEALIAWESALSKRLVSATALAHAAWPGPRQRRLARIATDRSDSLLETIVAYRLREEGIAFRQQEEFWGRPVDFVVEDRLVLQIDGFEHHAEPRQRRSDIEFDARLLAAGYPVVRRDFVGVVHHWPAFARDIRAALLSTGNSRR